MSSQFILVAYSGSTLTTSNTCSHHVSYWQVNYAKRRVWEDSSKRKPFKERMQKYPRDGVADGGSPTR